MVIHRVPPREDGFVPRTSGALAMVLVLLVVLGIWFLNGRDPGTGTTAFDPGDQTTSAQPSAPPSSEPTRRAMPLPGGVDLESGLDVVELADLPPQASDTVDLIDRGPPYPYAQHGSTFGNFEGILPDQPRGYYAEFTVETPGSDDRGARRIVAGDAGELYWTEDHYDSFERIRR